MSIKLVQSFSSLALLIAICVSGAHALWADCGCPGPYCTPDIQPTCSSAGSIMSCLSLSNGSHTTVLPWNAPCKDSTCTQCDVQHTLPMTVAGVVSTNQLPFTPVTAGFGCQVSGTTSQVICSGSTPECDTATGLCCAFSSCTSSTGCGSGTDNCGVACTIPEGTSCTTGGQSGTCSGGICVCTPNGTCTQTGSTCTGLDNCSNTCNVPDTTTCTTGGVSGTCSGGTCCIPNGTISCNFNPGCLGGLCGITYQDSCNVTQNATPLVVNVPPNPDTGVCIHDGYAGIDENITFAYCGVFGTRLDITDASGNCATWPCTLLGCSGCGGNAACGCGGTVTVTGCNFSKPSYYSGGCPDARPAGC